MPFTNLKLKKKPDFKGKIIQKLKDLYDISMENDRLNFTLIENRHCSTTIQTQHLKILLNVTIPKILSIIKKEKKPISYHKWKTLHA